MKVLIASLGIVGLLSGCISSSNPPPPEKTTGWSSPRSRELLWWCQDGSKPPCN